MHRRDLDHIARRPRTHGYGTSELVADDRPFLAVRRHYGVRRRAVTWAAQRATFRDFVRHGMDSDHATMNAIGKLLFMM